MVISREELIDKLDEAGWMVSDNGVAFVSIDTLLDIVVDCYYIGKHDALDELDGGVG